MALKPSPGWAVVKRVEAETATKSGIVIQSLAANDPSRGEVVAINYGFSHVSAIKELSIEEIDSYFALKDKVIVRHGTGQPVKLDGVEYALVEIVNIIAKVE